MHEDYNNWARKAWKGKDFLKRSVFKGEAVALCRQKSDAQIRVKEDDDPWRPCQPDSTPDKRVPTIRWLTLVVDRPLLVEIHYRRSTVRLLVTPDAPVVTDEEGQPRPSASQLDFMRIERIRVIANCNSEQAKELKSGILDKWSLQIYGFAAYLFKKFGYSGAKATVEQLWDCSPEQLRSTLPSQFQVLAVEDQLHSMKIKAGLNRCIELMASW